jgi:GT2 family glycosyltransferase
MDIDLSIVLLAYNNWNMIGSRMLDLRAYMPWEGCELVWVDNASPDEAVRTASKFWSQNFNRTIQFFQLEKNLFFGGGFNFGVGMARGKNVLLLSSDVKINTPNFVKNILTTLKDGKILAGGRVIDWDTGWNTHIIEGKRYIVPYCEGYALAVNKKDWEELGGFDEKLYSPYDYEDIDLSMNALSKGFTLKALPSEDYFHHGGQSISREGRESITILHKAAFLNKWKSTIPSVLEGLQ